MIRVILESPYAGNIEKNIKYARLAVRDSLSRGEAPIASHLLYTQEGILNDEIPEERQLITADNYQLTEIAKDIINKVTEDTIKIKNCYITQK